MIVQKVVTREEILALQEKGLENDQKVRAALNRFAAQNPPEELLNLFESFCHPTKRSRAPQVAHLLSIMNNRKVLQQFYNRCLYEFGDNFDGDRQLMSCLRADHFAINYRHCRPVSIAAGD